MANESNNGWFRMYRSILDWEWFRDPKTLQLFIACLAKAAYAPMRVGGEEIGRGSFVTSVDALCSATKLTPREVRTRLGYLQQTGEISIKATNRKSTITICKYDVYQPSELANDELATSKTTNSKRDIPQYESTSYKGGISENDEQNDELPTLPHLSTGIRRAEVRGRGDELKISVTNCNTDSCKRRPEQNDELATSKTTNSKRDISQYESTSYKGGISENDEQNDNKRRIYKEVNNNLSVAHASAHATRAERETFFEVFFFRNFRNPDKEVERFCANYEASGWVRKNGQPVVDRIALARGWTQEAKDAAPRFDAEFLRRYRSFHAAAKRINPEAAAVLIHDLQAVAIGEDRITIVCSGRMMEILERNADFFRKGFLTKYYDGRALHYRVPKN